VCSSDLIFAYLLVTGKETLLFSVTSLQFNWILLTSGLLLIYVLTWYNGLKHTNVSLATSVLLLGSPITLALNYLSGTVVGAFQLLGSIMIMLGVFVFAYFSEKRQTTWKA
jgi:drug/metabolite transporter (DMT)-like permease